ncbi:hypothetical protein BV898_03685 [Hypsibius exemplaris]|uniref:UEV domain-containing protein n=1 Tax=Hypsibius exemplaris TaxID=2072580 RepID=A0A1W0X599_HYPEX|nr:hypothetical protein BV898_03685 [Hypsibius exemplaris]
MDRTDTTGRGPDGRTENGRTTERTDDGNGRTTERTDDGTDGRGNGRRRTDGRNGQTTDNGRTTTTDDDTDGRRTNGRRRTGRRRQRNGTEDDGQIERENGQHSSSLAVEKFSAQAEAGEMLLAENGKPTRWKNRPEEPALGSDKSANSYTLERFLTKSLHSRDSRERRGKMAVVTLKTLQTQLNTKCRSPEITAKDVFKVISYYPDLRPTMAQYGASYNIPVEIWIMDSHPYNPPLCYVKPTPDMRSSITVTSTRTAECICLI